MVFFISVENIPFLCLLEHFAQSHIFAQPLDRIWSFGKEFNAYRLYIEFKFVQNGAIFLCKSHFHLIKGDRFKICPPPLLLFARINVAQWVETHFYRLTILHLVNTYLINTLDIAR